MAEFDQEVDITSKLAQEIQQELPTIYVSVKNLIACTMGKSYDEPLEPRIQPQNVMTCAKYLLQVIRSEPLPDLDQFCINNPQPEEQMGIDRIEDVCKYKVIYALRYKAEEKGGKITRLFGKSYIKWSKMWNIFRRKTEDLLQENTNIPMEEIEFFLQTYENSLHTKETREHRADTADLIWATDFNSVLNTMQKERNTRVEERNRATTDEMFSLEQQLFIPTTQPLHSGDGGSGSHSNKGSPTSRSNSLRSNNSCTSTGGTVDPHGIRSRATTMEQLGLEPPQIDGLMRLSNPTPTTTYDPLSSYEHTSSTATGHTTTSLRSTSPPTDRSRATTLDLFAFEQQQMSFPNCTNNNYLPTVPESM